MAQRARAHLLSGGAWEFLNQLNQERSAARGRSLLLLPGPRQRSKYLTHLGNSIHRRAGARGEALVTVNGMGHAGYTTEGGVRIPEAAMSWSYSASGGPGGQHANKTASKATLRIELSMLNLADREAEMLQARYGRFLQVYDSSSRSQAANREACLRKAGQQIDAALEHRTERRPGRVPERAKRERVDEKRRRGLIKKLRGSRVEGD